MLVGMRSTISPIQPCLHFIVATIWVVASCGDDAVDRAPSGDGDASSDVSTLDVGEDGDLALDAHDEADVGGADTGSDAATPDAADTSDLSGIPTIAEALDCRSSGSAGGLARGSELQRHDLDTAAFPEALCNDGTPAVFYFRPAATAAARDNWVIQLQGGGGCGTMNACAQRWCSVGTNFGATQMSADAAPLGGINGVGILNRRADNPIGDWNHVFLRYCSSDNWRGQARDQVIRAPHPRGSELVEMRVNFLGSRIIDAVLSTLRRDGVGALEYTAAGAATPMPDLDDASNVLFAGASAGGGGVANNADRVRAMLSETNTVCSDGSCPTFRALIDSSLSPALELLDFSASALCLDQGLCDHEALFTFMAEEGAGPMHDVLLEASCLAEHEASGDQWWCIDNTHLMTNHITSPLFVRMGQSDSLVSGNHIDAGYLYEGSPLDLAGFASITRDQLQAIADARTTAEEGEEIATPPGVYGPSCDKHETLRSNPDTFNVTVEVDGVALTMFDVLQNWVAGAQPAGAIAQSRDDSVCP